MKKRTRVALQQAKLMLQIVRHEINKQQPDANNWSQCSLANSTGCLNQWQSMGSTADDGMKPRDNQLHLNSFALCLCSPSPCAIYCTSPILSDTKESPQARTWYKGLEHRSLEKYLKFLQVCKICIRGWQSQWWVTFTLCSLMHQVMLMKTPALL